MKERPILFSGPMVRAILEGQKTQTRRPVTPQPRLTPRHLCKIAAGARGELLGLVCGDPERITHHCPYGLPGNRLWVRETWALCEALRVGEFGGDLWETELDAESPIPKQPTRDRDRRQFAIYRADGDEGPWRSSIHMPRWASRLTLEITDIRVERVQAISDADALAEGIGAGAPPDYVWVEGRAANKFRALWDDINGPRGFGWDANPWVWVLEFRRLEATS